MTTIWNFSAGPSMVPQEVLIQAQKELLDWQGLGVSVMEVSHRSSEFEALAQTLKQDLRDLLNLPDSHDILFTTGGAQSQFAFVPMNFLNPSDTADYLLTGLWSEKAAIEAKRFADIRIVADGKATNFTTVPAFHMWRQNPASKYFHYVSNETVHGLQFHEYPEVDKPLVIDMSSDILSKPIDFDRVALIYAGAQKNIGSAGLTLLIIHRDWLKRMTGRAPSIYDYAKLAASNSLSNTPPTFSWYITSLVLKWLKRQGGLAAMAVRNQEKAQLLYDAIDQSDFYHNSVDPCYRSTMNVVFDFKDPNLLSEFLVAAKAAGLVGLKGHKMRGGIRASIYNAMPKEGVHALIEFMKAFENDHSGSRSASGDPQRLETRD